MTDRFKELKQILSCGSSSSESLFCRGDDLNVIRGVSNLQTFNLPFSANIAKDLEITYFQDEYLVLKKKIKDLKFNNNVAYFMMSEDESLRFKDGIDSIVQIKSVLLNSEIILSEKQIIKVSTALDTSKVHSTNTVLAAIAYIKDQSLLVNCLADLIAESNVYRCSFVFDASWEDFAKEYIFKDEYNHEVSLTTNADEITIPSDVLSKPGKIYIKVKGTNGSLVKYTELSNSLTVNL